MAILWAESFDHYDAGAAIASSGMFDGLWAEILGGNFSLSNTLPRTGTYALKIETGGGLTRAYIRRVLGYTSLAFGVGYGLHMASLPGNNISMGLTLRSAANAELFTLTYNSDGSLSFREGDNEGPVLATSGVVLTANAYNHIELKTIIDPIVGEVELRVNGVVVMQETDLDLGSTGIASIGWDRFSNSGTTVRTQHIDDIVLWDTTGPINNDFLGAQRVLCVFPDADSTPIDWAVTGAASGAAAVDDNPSDGDTSYITAADPGDIEVMGLPTLPAEVSGVAGVHVLVFGKIEAAGTGSVAVSMLSDASETPASEHALSTSYVYKQSIFNSDPDGDIAWTKAAVEAASVKLNRTV